MKTGKTDMLLVNSLKVNGKIGKTKLNFFEIREPMDGTRNSVICEN